MGDDEKAMLVRYLRLQRDALRWKVDGVSERDARMPMTVTGTNLLGLVKHVATVSVDYLGDCVGRPFGEPMPWSADDAEANADMWAGPDETMAGVLALWDRAWAHIDGSLEALPLDAPAHVPWWGEHGNVTMRRLIVHLIAEIARHAGHADILREQLDGATGLRDGVSNLPDGDADWWADYVARLRATAEASSD